MANGANQPPHREAVLVEPNLASIAKGLEALIVRQEAVEHVLVQLVRMEHESGKKRDALQGILMPLALRSGLVNPDKLKEALDAKA